ncbi:hypothetical protein [Hymenobacter armeniacus]
MVRVTADGGLVGLVYLMPLGGVTVVVFGNFRQRVTAYHGVRIAGGGWIGIGRVSEKISAASSRLRCGLYGFLLAFVAEKIKESHGFVPFDEKKFE